MGDLLPKNDYFKHTTRAILTEAEKQEIVDAAERALGYLLGRIRTQESKITFTSFANAAIALKTLKYSQRHLDRCLHLVKGTRQPRYLYRRSRRIAVEVEAYRIAMETGAPYREVKEEFLSLMENYISPQP
jgi:hypothetical protein